MPPILRLGFLLLLVLGTGYAARNDLAALLFQPQPTATESFSFVQAVRSAGWIIAGMAGALLTVVFCGITSLLGSQAASSTETKPE